MNTVYLVDTVYTGGVSSSWGYAFFNNLDDAIKKFKEEVLHTSLEQEGWLDYAVPVSYIKAYTGPISYSKYKELEDNKLDLTEESLLSDSIDYDFTDIILRIEVNRDNKYCLPNYIDNLIEVSTAGDDIMALNKAIDKFYRNIKRSLAPILAYPETLEMVYDEYLKEDLLADIQQLNKEEVICDLNQILIASNACYQAIYDDVCNLERAYEESLEDRK